MRWVDAFCSLCTASSPPSLHRDADALGVVVVDKKWRIVSAGGAAGLTERLAVSAH
jgi:hypothetical protein